MKLFVLFTSDGYGLLLERISRDARKAVFLQHGVLDSWMGWVWQSISLMSYFVTSLSHLFFLSSDGYQMELLDPLLLLLMIKVSAKATLISQVFCDNYIYTSFCGLPRKFHQFSFKRSCIETNCFFMVLISL